MTLYTIGSGKKSARDFFTLLQENGVKRVIDIRLNNTSQLAGYSKKADLAYFLGAIAGIDYLHLTEFAPTGELMEGYRAKKISQPEFAEAYIRLIEDRQTLRRLDHALLDSACLLCSEPAPKHCHRRLLAEYLAERIPGMKVVHL